MSVMIIIGAQWGDEGKGKVVDYLTEQSQLVVRFQGGNNAGHTLYVNGIKTALKLIPSGILRPTTRCLLASGVVIDPHALLDEVSTLRQAGVSISPERLGISGEVALILPYHKAIDSEREEKKGDSKIGTTGKGIGPAYEDAVSRQAIRLADIFNTKRLTTLVRDAVAVKNLYLSAVLGSSQQFSVDEIVSGLQAAAIELKPYLANVSKELDCAIKANQRVIFEGAQGSLLDINHGTYPFVTSSNTVSGFACVSGGIGPRHISAVLGVCKAYCTRVGAGPFPSEDFAEAGQRLREVGREFGTVTGRPRRCGWLDIIALKRAIRLNGIDSLIITKLDILSGFSEIKLATSYRLDGAEIDDLPVLAEDIERVEVVYESLPAWTEDLTKVSRLEDLPTTAQSYLKRIEQLCECSIGGFSVGPGREQTIIVDQQIREFAQLTS